MSALLPVAEARKLIIDGLKPVAVETVALADAAGRILRADAVAMVSHPPADVSAMDGYALRFGDVAAVPHTVPVIGESAAGHPWSGVIGENQAVRIFTGAHVPKGADTIVIQEDTDAGDSAVIIKEKPQRARHIRPAGQDFRAGDTVLTAPRRLTARDIGLLAAMNLASVPVSLRPRVGVLSTGDEIVLPGQPIADGQIVSANGPGLCAFVAAHGAEAVHLGVVKDDLAALRDAIGRAEPLDLLVTSGGVSVGDHDLVAAALRSADFAMVFHKIAMRPGKPLLFGHVRGMPVLGLPGNPVSAMVCAILFLGSALARLQGLAGDAPEQIPARLGVDLKANDGRQDHMRATLSRGADGTVTATPLPAQDSAMIAALARAQALIVRPPYAPAAKAGDTVPVISLD